MRALAVVVGMLILVVGILAFMFGLSQIMFNPVAGVTLVVFGCGFIGWGNIIIITLYGKGHYDSP